MVSLNFSTSFSMKIKAHPGFGEYLRSLELDGIITFGEYAAPDGSTHIALYDERRHPVGLVPPTDPLFQKVIDGDQFAAKVTRIATIESGGPVSHFFIQVSKVDLTNASMGADAVANNLSGDAILEQAMSRPATLGSMIEMLKAVTDLCKILGMAQIAAFKGDDEAQRAELVLFSPAFSRLASLMQELSEQAKAEVDRIVKAAAAPDDPAPKSH